MKILPFIFVLFLLVGCETTDPMGEMTPLEIQSLQTRSFDHGYNVTFRSVVSVFQDLGYIIKSADIETGFIQADGASESDYFLRYFEGETETWQTRVTAFVEQIGNRTMVRLNFVDSVESSTVFGARDREDIPILDAHIYQNAFEKIGSAIFLREASQ